MRNTLGASLIGLLLTCSFVCFSADKRNETTVKVSDLNFSDAAKLVTTNSLDLGKAGFSAGILDLERGQLFSVSYRGNQYLIVPVTRESTNGIAAFTCSILLFSADGRLVSAADILGSGESRPWTCDGVLAIAFADIYPDGSLGIISIYEGTAPSSERFQLPVVLKASLAKRALTVDEQKTELLARKKVRTIKAAKNVLR